MSVGVATLPDVAASAEQLVKAADEAMYWVKEHGKNSVHVAHRTDENAQSARNAKTVRRRDALDIRVRRGHRLTLLAVVAFPAHVWHSALCTR